VPPVLRVDTETDAIRDADDARKRERERERERERSREGA
jgi:hypothetical protein